MAYLLAGEDFAANLQQIAEMLEPALTGNSSLFWCWRRHLTGMLILPPGLRRGCLAGRRISGVVHRVLIFGCRSSTSCPTGIWHPVCARNGAAGLFTRRFGQQPFRFYDRAPSAELGAFPGRFGIEGFLN